ncbi:phage antirepressor KilAC domain-containing protein [Curtobacterium sp. MCLR17_042]|uniref:phage antirepressor KilAC domain-containing protein n=1 Tax=Curtobacterium sp. MCLR17_042 TaxID=2175626 RepID=UPI000DAA3228|nr:phage antirepressor KilAC domain-containing protein [Curtobacterium sp. MCLR17_042]PZE31798.1 phage regulatory protein/antirepressor Ant [Curtobacterium sp. MCLR17_042]
MSEVTIRRHDDELVVSSETIADGSGVQHKNVLELISSNLADFEEFGRVAFETRPFETSGGVQSRRVALLNEQQATLLMTFQRNTQQVRQFKKSLVRAFFEMARQRTTPALPRSLPDALRAYAAEVEQREALEAKAAADAPKVLFADSVSTSATAILVGDLAKILKGNGVDVGANRLFEMLRNDGYLIRRKGTDWNMPTQRSMELGLFKVKETAVTHSDGHVTVNKTPKVTGKGQAYFVNRYSALRAVA